MDDKTKKPLETIMATLPLICIISTVSLIPSSKRRKNAVMKMIAVEYKKQIEQARASEREKCQWNKATIAEIAEIKKEAYAKGKADEIKKWTIDQYAFKEGYKKGQADTENA